jgi:hypothetical protein
MPSGLPNYPFELRLAKARDEINEALRMGVPPMAQAQPGMMPQQPMQQPMGQMQPGMMPPQQMPQQMPMGQPQMQQPMQQPQQPRPFQEGGLATSLRTNPADHERDVAFVASRDQQLRDMAGKRPFAKGGLAMAEGGAWTRKEGKNPEGGLNAKGRASLKAQGHDIKPPVSAKQAKKSPKAAARRRSFCARMSGMPGAMKDENGKPTRKALALRKWDC